MRVESTRFLSGDQSEVVTRLAGAAAHADGVSPLSEAAWLALRPDAASAGSDPSGARAHAISAEPEASSAGSDAAGSGESSGRTHLLAYDGPHVIGYASLECPEGGNGSAEIVVDPGRRRAGAGRALLEAVLAAAPDARLWSHGHLEAARRLGSAAGLTPGRELWVMARRLGPEGPELPPAVVPAGFGTRAFVPGRDEQAWLQVNARAFASHPEQGRMTLADLAQREDEPWFDPAGLILIEDLAGTAPRLAASHWTKVAEPSAPGEPAAGEVYVVGVDPAYQGRGLGRAVTLLGLAHLQARGLRRVLLYVDGDNAAAVATYTRLGFERTTMDVMYHRAAPA